jgi:uncharacterized protein (TIGR02453 family)
MPASLQYALDFLRDLRANNNREWFNKNRARYDKARAAYEDFVQAVIDRFDVVDDFGNLSAEQTMYRIHRDIRFSPDKTPYKTEMGALLGKEGRKSMGRSYYIHLQPDDNSFLATGLYMPSPAELEKVRRAIAEDSRPLRSILNAKDFKRYFGEMQGEQVKTAPKGYSKDDPDIDLLRYKQFMAVHPLTDQQMLADDLVDDVIERFKAMKPFADYLYGILDG